MPLIIVKRIGKRCEFIFIPKSVLSDMLTRHVRRTHLAPGRPNTCIVTPAAGWTGIPSDRQVIRLLWATLKERRTQPGIDRIFQFSPDFRFAHLVCREFFLSPSAPTGVPTSPVNQGAFVITLERIHGRAKPLLRAITPYESIGVLKAFSIRRKFAKLPPETCDPEFVLIATHMHVMTL